MPRIIYVSGIPRSGSTWAFNVCRIAMWRTYGEKNVGHAYGVGDESKHVCRPDAEYQVIKSHEFIEERCDNSVVIHSTRNYQQAIQSWRIKTPGITALPPYLQHLDKQWQPFANFTFHRIMLDDNILRKITAANICRIIVGMPYDDGVKVSTAVDRLPIPSTNAIDPVTFLQRNSRTPKGKRKF